MPPSVLARDIVAYSDTELDQYLEANRVEGVEGGASVIRVKDPGNLPEIRARHAHNAACSRAVNLDDVNTRLLAISADRDASPPSWYRPSDPEYRTPPPPTEEEFETEAYNSLVGSGGRPCYPLNLLQDVANDPGAYQEILRPWLDFADAHPPRWRVFENQSRSWKLFREWQKYSRKDLSPSVEDLLRRHDFPRPFQYQEDPLQQDKLTTWIEYLGFEYARYERYIHVIKLRQPMFDEAWKVLVDSGVLRPSETYEYICTPASSSERRAEREAAQDVVDSLKSAAKAAAMRYKAAQKSLPRRNTGLQGVRRRNNLITDFHITVREYKIVKWNADTHEPILQWILDQVPLIEAELIESNASNASPRSDRDPVLRIDSGSQEEDHAHVSDVPIDDGSIDRESRQYQARNASETTKK
ncbi:hypothetical protein F5B20DRAFT_572505 [Whalleya microplaca]|nr:hypothetical protein F5B20DRAFT_572505 [Whalleya microplaca]